MKPFAIFLIVVCTGCVVTRPRYHVPTDREKNNLKGNVTRTASIYMDLNGELPDDPDRSTEFDLLIVSIYNPQGNITREETFAGGGKVKSREDIYFYDESGLKIQSSEFHDLINNKLTWVKYDYDKKGRVSSYRPVSGDWICSYSYGGKSYPKTTNDIVGDSITRTVRFSYDGRGHLKAESDGEFTKTYKYHRNGSLKEVVNSSETDHYDTNGDLIRSLSTIIIHSDSGETSKLAVTEAKYLYDERGNWITRELYLGDEFYGVWKREIEYAD